MNRDLFIDTLRRALYGKVDERALADHVSYYEGYILQEMTKGRSEQEVLEELGDPRLIAKTILETSAGKSSMAGYTVVDETGEEQSGQFRTHRYEGWKATLILVLAVLIVLLILALVFKVVIALLPILVVAGAVLWIVKKLV